MASVFGNHPTLGSGDAGSRKWVWISVLGLLCFPAGIALTYFNPVMAIVGLFALLGLLIFIRLCIDHPTWTLCLVIAAQILVPVYVRPMGIPPPLVMLAILIMLTAATRMLNPEPTRSGRYQSLLATGLLIFNMALLLTIPNEWASNVSYSMLIKTGLIPTSLFFVMLATIKSPDQLRNVFTTITVAAVACGVLALHEFSIGKSLLAQYLAPPVTIEEDFFLYILANSDEGGPYLDGAIYRVYSFFSQPLEYSAFMTMAFSFAALTFVTTKSMSARVFYGLATAIIFAGFMVSFSRGPTLALALVILFLGVYERRVRPWILSVTVMVIGGVIVMWPYLVEKLGERVTGSENVTLRFSLWKNGLKIFADNPLRGIGYGSYPNYHVESIRENQIGPMYEYTWPHIERVTTVENIFVALAAETGLLGLSTFAFLIGISFMVFRRIYFRCADPQVRLLALSAFAAMLAYMLTGMTVANFTLYTISVLFFGVYFAALAILSKQLPDGRAPLALNLGQSRVDRTGNAE